MFVPLTDTANTESQSEPAITALEFTVEVKPPRAATNLVAWDVDDFSMPIELLAPSGETDPIASRIHQKLLDESLSKYSRIWETLAQS